MDIFPGRGDEHGYQEIYHLYSLRRRGLLLNNYSIEFVFHQDYSAEIRTNSVYDYGSCLHRLRLFDHIANIVLAMD